jgi:pimeloyl-ACP methyl ester carboxylesterase
MFVSAITQPASGQSEDKAHAMPVSATNGVSIYYEVAGNGPALCLINGYRLSSAAWPEAFIGRLAGRCHIVSFDNRGTGYSAKPPAGYDFGNMARDVVGLLDNLRLPRVHLLGFSMGGAIAQEIAIRFPHRIDRLILFATFCGGIWAEPASYDVYRRLLVTEYQSPEEAARQIWPVTYSPDYLAANARAVEQQMWRELRHPTPTFVAQRQMEALQKFDTYYDLPKISAPTLVATGEEDVLVKPRNSEILASRIPNVRLEVLADLGHRAIWEAPEEIADLFGDFLTAPSRQDQPHPATGTSEGPPR